MSEDNLYRVWCASPSGATIVVYVLAQDMNEASRKALGEMKRRMWAWDQYISRVELTAVKSGDKAPGILIV